MKFRFSDIFVFFLLVAFLPFANVVIATQGTGYIIGEDRRISEIDLKSGAITRQSKPLGNVGGIANIAINPDGNKLYIASDRSINGKAFSPIVVINLGDDDFKQMSTFYTEPRFDLENDPLLKEPLQNMAFRVAVSPDGTELFVLDAAGPTSKPTAVVDAKTGHLKYRTRIGVGLDDLVSPDNQILVEMWPEAQLQRNNKVIDVKAGITVSNIRLSKRLYKKEFENAPNFQPPWTKLDSYFIYLWNAKKQLFVYQRSTGEKVNEIALKELLNCGPDSRFARLPENNTLIALTARCTNEQDIVVIIDVVKASVVKRINVPKVVSNIVIKNSKSH